MAVDQYALCPCGSGKKIKFCKCVDSIGEMDKVVTMITGNQVVAALDRINQLLQQHPSAAWALAIKGRLLMNLSEMDALMENAERFIRLQPSNPLALAQKAASLVFRERVTEAAHTVLEALAESRQGIDSFLLEIVSILSVALLRERKFLSARLYASIPLMVSEFEHGQFAESVLNELNESRTLNNLLKSMPEVEAYSPSAVWAERFEEAYTLLMSHQVLAAESKLEGLDRQYPKEPALLSSLLLCAIWRADTDAQQRLLVKLSDVAADDETAARLLATSFIVDPKMKALMVPMSDFEYEISDVEQTILAFTSNPRTRAIPGEALRGLDMGEVPPKAGYQILDKPMIAAGEPLVADHVPIAIGTVLVFGRQTDRAPYLKVLDILPFNRGELGAMLQEIAGVTQPTSEVGRELSLIALAAPRMVLEVNPRQLPEYEGVIDQVSTRTVPAVILQQSLSCTNGKKIAELVNDPSTLRLRTALLRSLQGVAELKLMIGGALKSLEQQLQVPPLIAPSPRTEEDVENLSAFDLIEVDPSHLNFEDLYYLFQRAMQSGCLRTVEQCTALLVEKPVTDEESKEMIFNAFTALMSVSRHPQSALDVGQRARQWCQQHNVNDSRIMLNEIIKHLELGDPAGFEKSIQGIVAKHGKDQRVMAQLQQLLVQVGVLNPDGSPRRTQAPAPAKSSGLWTGGPEPVETPAANSDAGQGGSKLWLPGMS